MVVVVVVVVSSLLLSLVLGNAVLSAPDAGNRTNTFIDAKRRNITFFKTVTVVKHSSAMISNVMGVSP